MQLVWIILHYQIAEEEANFEIAKWVFDLCFIKIVFTLFIFCYSYLVRLTDSEWAEWPIWEFAEIRIVLLQEPHVDNPVMALWSSAKASQAKFKSAVPACFASQPQIFHFRFLHGTQFITSRI